MSDMTTATRSAGMTRRMICARAVVALAASAAVLGCQANREAFYRQIVDYGPLHDTGYHDINAEYEIRSMHIRRSFEHDTP